MEAPWLTPAATECGFEILPHIPYSPDMDPSDFHLLGTHYESNEGVIAALNEYFGDQEEASILKG